MCLSKSGLSVSECIRQIFLQPWPHYPNPPVLSKFAVLVTLCRMLFSGSTMVRESMDKSVPKYVHTETAAAAVPLSNTLLQGV